MGRNESVAVVLEAFQAVQRRDGPRLRAVCHPEVEFHWPSPLPYAGTSGAAGATDRRRPGWDATWDPLQPTEAERRMDPRIVAAGEDEVVVLWRQRGVSPSGERLDSPVLGLYGVRDGKFARAQMFYYDPAGVAGFLARAAARGR